MGFRAPQGALDQLSPGVRSIFEVDAPRAVRPESEDIFGLTKREFQGVGAGLRRDAERSGLNPFTQLRIGQARQAAQSGAGKAAGQLASQGGLRSGALERLRSSAQGQGLDAQTDLAIADQQQRQRSQSQLAGIEGQRAGALGQAAQFDVGQRARERQLQNFRDLADRDALRESLAFEQQARATEAGGPGEGLFGGGGFAGTGLDFGGLNPTKGIFGNSAFGKAANVATTPVTAPFKILESIF